MEERIRPTKSGLFAIELLIAVGVFTLCAAICMGLFVRAEVMSRDSADLTRAVNEARSVAECWKAAGGDLSRTAELLDGTAEGNALLLRFDSDWNRVGDGGEFQIELLPESGSAEGLREADLSVTRGDAQLLDWSVTALEVTP